MALTRTSLTTGGTTSDATSFATASVTPTAGWVQILWVANTRGSAVDTPTVTGCGLTWVQINTQASGGVRRVTGFRACGTPSTGTLTIDFGGSTQTGCAWALEEWNADNTGSNGANAVVQNATNAAGADTQITMTLAALSGGGNNGVSACAAIASNSALTAGSGFTRYGNTSFGTPNFGFASEYSTATSDNTVDFTFSSAANLGMAIEIKTGDQTITAAVGSFSLASVAAATNFRIGQPSDVGAFTLSGQDVVFRASTGSTFTASPMSFVLSGQAVTFNIGLVAATGAFVLTGNDAAFATNMIASEGAYTLTGNDALLGLTGSGLAASAGSFVLTGQAVAFKTSMAASVGAFSVTGADVFSVSETGDTGCFFYLINVADADGFPTTDFYQSMVMLPSRYTFTSSLARYVLMAAETTDSQHASILNHWPQPSGWTGTVEEARTIMRDHNLNHCWWLFDFWLSNTGFRESGDFR